MSYSLLGGPISGMFIGIVITPRLDEQFASFPFHSPLTKWSDTERSDNFSSFFSSPLLCGMNSQKENLAPAPPSPTCRIALNQQFCQWNMMPHAKMVSHSCIVWWETVPLSGAWVLCRSDRLCLSPISIQSRPLVYIAEKRASRTSRNDTDQLIKDAAEQTGALHLACYGCSVSETSQSASFCHTCYFLCDWTCGRRRKRAAVIW